MWDLQEIIRQNNQAAIDWMQQGKRAAQAEAPMPEAWSLAILSDKLRYGPPLLGELATRFAATDTIETFLAMIVEYLPNYKAAILKERGSRRLQKFVYLFGKEWYPLPRWCIDHGIGEFVSKMPVELMAMSYSAYHELDMRPGYILLLSLLPYPYEGSMEDEYHNEDYPESAQNGAKVPLLDMVDQLVGHDLVVQIPDAGWRPEVLHTITDGTEYEGLGHFADWVFSQTGCVVLDNSYADCDFMEGYGEPIFRWSMRNVKMLREQQRSVDIYRGKIDRLVEWLEYDKSRRFQELLEFLIDNEPVRLKKPAKKKKGFPYDPTEHWCPLDQESNEDEADEEE